MPHMCVKKNEPDGFITTVSRQQPQHERTVSSNSNSFNKQADFPDTLVGIELTKYNQEFKPDGVCGRHRKPEERGPVGTA